jgi:hypothetical protein
MKGSTRAARSCFSGARADSEIPPPAWAAASIGVWQSFLILTSTSRVREHVPDALLVIQELLVLAEISECSQEDNPHLLVHAVH